MPSISDRQHHRRPAQYSPSAALAVTVRALPAPPVAAPAVPGRGVLVLRCEGHRVLDRGNLFAHTASRQLPASHPCARRRIRRASSQTHDAPSGLPAGAPPSSATDPVRRRLSNLSVTRPPGRGEREGAPPSGPPPSDVSAPHFLNLRRNIVAAAVTLPVVLGSLIATTAPASAYPRPKEASAYGYHLPPSPAVSAPPIPSGMLTVLMGETGKNAGSEVTYHGKAVPEGRVPGRGGRARRGRIRPAEHLGRGRRDRGRQLCAVDAATRRRGRLPSLVELYGGKRRPSLCVPHGPARCSGVRQG